MAKAVTIYHCGTAYDANSPDLIPVLARATEGARGVDGELCAGAGSIAQMKRDGTFPPAAALLDWVTDSPMGTYLVRETLAKLPQGLGDGMRQSAALSLAFVERTQPSIVNLAGWSRGAIACIWTASLLAKKYPRIPVHMFLFDPVVGDPVFNENIHPLIAALDGGSIGASGTNVRAAMVIQQIDEARWIMQPHASFGSSRGAGNTKLLALPGVHSSAVEPGSPSDKYAETFAIGFGLAKEFLQDHGTSFRSFSRFSAEKYLELYSALWLKGAGALYASRAKTVRATSTSIFNAHHMEVMQRVLPKNQVALAYVLSLSATAIHPDLAKAAIAEIQYAQNRTDIPRTLEYLGRHRWYFEAISGGAFSMKAQVTPQANRGLPGPEIRQARPMR